MPRTSRRAWLRELAVCDGGGDRIVEVTAYHVVIERPRATGELLMLRFWMMDA
jgi:hypothetical protein